MFRRIIEISIKNYDKLISTSIFAVIYNKVTKNEEICENIKNIVNKVSDPQIASTNNPTIKETVNIALHDFLILMTWSVLKVTMYIAVLWTVKFIIEFFLSKIFGTPISIYKRIMKLFGWNNDDDDDDDDDDDTPWKNDVNKNLSDIYRSIRSIEIKVDNNRIYQENTRSRIGESFRLLSASINDNRSTLDNAISTIANTLTSLNNAIDGIRTRISNITTNLQSGANELRKIKVRLDNQEKWVSENVLTKTDITDIGTKISNIETNLSNLESTLSRLDMFKIANELEKMINNLKNIDENDEKIDSARLAEIEQRRNALIDIFNAMSQAYRAPLETLQNSVNRLSQISTDLNTISNNIRIQSESISDIPQSVLTLLDNTSQLISDLSESMGNIRLLQNAMNHAANRRDIREVLQLNARINARPNGIPIAVQGIAIAQGVSLSRISQENNYLSNSLRTNILNTIERIRINENLEMMGKCEDVKEDDIYVQPMDRIWNDAESQIDEIASEDIYIQENANQIISNSDVWRAVRHIAAQVVISMTIRGATAAIQSFIIGGGEPPQEIIEGFRTQGIPERFTNLSITTIRILLNKWYSVISGMDSK